ncbi:MAG TPA: nuclear transport factor 2 family protein [Pseudonocardia sp.]|jgi:hypothetical protein
MSSPNATVVQKFLDAFAGGDVTTALSCFAEDCVVDEAHGLPFSGRYVGRAGFLDILGRMSAHFDAKVTSVQVLDAGEVVVGKLGLTFTSKTTGRELATTVVELYTVEQGEITQADVYYKDPAALSALAG